MIALGALGSDESDLIEVARSELVSTSEFDNNFDFQDVFSRQVQLLSLFKLEFEQKFMELVIFIRSGVV